MIPKSGPGKHRRHQPPTWVGLVKIRWYLITVLVILIVLTLGGAL